MTILPELRARVSEPPDDANILWYHPGFSQFSLPAESGGAVAWHRELGGTSVSIEPGSERDRLPGGPMLRRLLMHLCDSALRAEQSQVPLGEDATALAAMMTPPVTGDAIRALEVQVAAMLACRIVLSTEGGPGLSVLDARGRPRAVAQEWRPSMRLNARFLDNLDLEKAALDRAVIAQIQGSALALDIYAWLAATLPSQVGQTVLAESWPELHARFGAEGQDSDAFQAAFAAALFTVPARRALFARRFSESAWLAARRGQESRARSLWACALALEAGRPVSSIPAVDEMTRLSLAFALEARAKRASEESRSSLIVTPAQAMAEARRPPGR